MMSTKLERLITLFEQLETWDTEGRRSISSAPVFDGSNQADNYAVETPLSQTVNRYNELTTQIRELVEKHPNDKVLTYLTTCLSHSKTLIRQQAAEALGYTRSISAISALSDTLRNDSDISVRTAAAESLGIIGSNLATSVLIAELQGAISQKTDVKLHWSLAQALSFIGDPSATDVLIDSLTRNYGAFEESASETREAARDALVSIGSEDVVDKLVHLWGKSPLHPVEDVDWFIRHEFIAAFSQIEHPKALDFLLTLAHHDQPIVREMVMSALTYPQDPRIVPILTEALNDSDFYVRDAAEFALQRLGKHLP